MINTLRSSQSILGYFIVFMVAVTLISCASDPPTPTPMPTLTPTPEAVTFHNYVGDCYNQRVDALERIASEWETVLVSDIDDLDVELIECVVDAALREEAQGVCWVNFVQDIRDAATYGNADAQTIVRAKAKLRQCVGN